MTFLHGCFLRFLNCTNGMKDNLYLSPVSTHHNLVFNLQIFMSWSVHVSKNVFWIFHARFLFVFIKLNFLFNKKHGLLGPDKFNLIAPNLLGAQFYFCVQLDEQKMGVQSQKAQSRKNRSRSRNSWKHCVLFCIT